MTLANMEFVADLHLHSKYSRAVSPAMNLSNMALWASKKGLDILSASDWTHPLWFRQIREELEEASEGLFRLKTKDLSHKSEVSESILFLLSVEVSSIYTQNGKVRRIHNLIWSPSFETCEKISQELRKRGCNLSSDGRPIIGLSSIVLAELVFSIDKKAMIIPCHAWTPWFSLYGSNSGFDSIDECFGSYAKYIYAVETGLSSDPFMNWQIEELDNRSILSFSDAHSMAKMGREATVFELQELTFDNIKKAIMQPYLTMENRKLKVEAEDRELKIDNNIDSQPSILKKPSSTINHLSSNRIAYTIEFYPEEGKYHYTGHRNCNFVQDTAQTKQNGTICPVCKRPLTVGVMHRVEDLADPNLKFQISNLKLDERGVKWIYDTRGFHPPFIKLVPLNEIIAESLFSTVASLKVKNLFDDLCKEFESELNVLLRVSIKDIAGKAGERVAEGIEKVRKGEIVILPGFDGQYGIVKIWEDKEINEKHQETVDQLGIDF